MLSMSKMLKIDQIYLRAVMLSMSEMSKIDQILCILKHVKDVEDNLRHLQHASIYIGFDGMVGKP